MNHASRTYHSIKLNLEASTVFGPLLWLHSPLKLSKVRRSVVRRMRKPKFDTTTLPLAGLANRKAMAEDPPINGELDYLFHSFFHHLQRVLGKNKLPLIVRDPGTAMYTIVANQGYRGDLGKTQFAEDSPLIRHFVTQPMPIHHSQMDKQPWTKMLSKQQRRAWDGLRHGMLVPLFTKHGLLGLVVLEQSIPEPISSKSNECLIMQCTRFVNILGKIEGIERLTPDQMETAEATGGPDEPKQLVNLEQQLGGVTHNLNNVLATIVSRTELLEQERWGHDVRRHTAAIRRAALDWGEIVKRMNSFTKASSESPGCILDLNEIIRSTLKLIEPRWQRGRLSSCQLKDFPGPSRSNPNSNPSFKWREGPPTDLVATLGQAGRVYGYASELRSALTNIIANAVEAIPSEGGCIQVVSYWDGNWAVVEVKDNGLGVPPQIRERIFEPFFTSKGNESRGLGLSVSRDIISRHGGKVEVKSRDGAGSTFIIRLPLAEPASTQKAMPA